LPNGKRKGIKWHAGSVSGEAGKSLSVILSGEKAGIWSDFAEKDNKGDLLDLWCAVKRITLREALKEACNWLGIKPPEFYRQKTKTYRRPEINPAGIAKNTEVMEYLICKRKLALSTIRAFKISAENREIIFPYFRNGELLLVKYLHLDRPDDKKQIRVSPNCEPCLFGWQAFPQNLREVTITEGEIDAMSLHQYGFPALSVPFGAGAGTKHEWLEHEFEHLEIFGLIYLCFDQDDAGQAAVAELLDRLGRHRCRVVTLPLKDANECLQAEITAEQIKTCFANARSIDPEELKRAKEFSEHVVREFYPPEGFDAGIAPPWITAKNKIMFRPCELSVWTGINGHGKSQFLGQIVLHTLQANANVCIASLELKPQKLLMRLTRQASGLEHPSKNYIRVIHDWYGDKLWLFDLVGTAKSKRLLDVFLYARQRYGIEHFVIDSLLKCDIAEDDYNAQKAFIEQLCDFKNEHNCHIHLVVHPRKGSDEAKPPSKLDAKGTGAISDLADNCFTVWRNKKKEERIRKMSDKKLKLNDDKKKKLEKILNEQRECLWICDKQRNGEWEGRIGLWFDPKSMQYLCDHDEKPIRYVNYSNRENQDE
ncbi:MAG: bifunctional DNA primase/helicase, partial [Planctomycetota bacterium]